MTLRRFFEIVAHIPRNIRRAWFWYLANISRNGVLIFTGGLIDRSTLWRITGCKMGKNVSIGLDVYYDVGNAKLLTVEDEINYLKETSVKLAFSTSHRDFTASDNAYAIPRYGITLGSLFFIKLKLLLGERYLQIKQTLKKVCF